MDRHCFPNGWQVKLQLLSADQVDSLAYPVKEGKDPFFIFYQSRQVLIKPGASGPPSRNREVIIMSGAGITRTCSGFDPPFQSDSNLPSSTVSDLDDGAYQVRIFNGGGTDTSMMAWVMLDRLHAWVHKTEDGKLDPVVP